LRRKLTVSSFIGLAPSCFFTGLSRADLDPLHLMYLMVVVVAGVDAVDDVSLRRSETIWCCRTAVKNKKSHGEDFGMSYRVMPPVP
jgi:hypothetical protein